ncbi:outer membrane beta-barrel protein [Pleionea sediminis]|uniref:outer membrane beta-barrel protein n=1 Tax=Pleionea sediminis TaxID=2569479 RepID=UPI001186AA7B|nr:outer membrane beta-barrel protein [Pleionea sediminis]
MNRKIIGLSLASLLSVSAFAGDYFGVSYRSVSVESGSTDIDLNAIEGKYGRMFTENVGLESRFGLGIGDEDGISIDGSVSVFGVYRYKINDMFTPYGLVGYSSTEFGFEGSSGSEGLNDFSYGFGLDIAIDKKSAVNVEFTELFDNSGAEGSSISAGWIYSF